MAKGAVDNIVISVNGSDKKATIENGIMDFLHEIIRQAKLGSYINEVLTPTTQPRRSAPGIVMVSLADSDAENAADFLEVLNAALGSSPFGKYISNIEAPGLRDPGKARKQKSAPGYVFLQADMSDVVQHLITQTPGFLGWTDGKRQVRDPLPIPAEQLHEFFQNAPDIDNPLEDAPVAPGHTVKVRNGHFAGYEGVVEKFWPTRNRAWVRIEESTAPTQGYMPLTRTRNNVDPADPARRERMHEPRGGTGMLIDVSVADLDRETQAGPRLHDATEFPAEESEEITP